MYTWGTDGVRWHCESLVVRPEDVEEHWTRAYNGEVTVEYDWNRRLGYIYPEEREAAEFRRDAYFLLTQHGPSEHSTSLSRVIEESTSRTLDDASVNGVRCLRVRLNEPGDRVETFWLAPQYGCAPVRLTIRWSNPGSPVRYMAVFEAREFTECAPGVWLPLLTVRHSYSWAPASQPRWLTTKTYRLLEVHVGEYPEGFSELTLPLGSTVVEVGRGSRLLGGSVEDALQEAEHTPRPSWEEFDGE